MLDNKMQDFLAYWNGLSLTEHEVFITRSCAELVNGMVEAKDEKGLEVLRENLNTLIDFTVSMQYELEMQIRREEIAQNLGSLYAAIKQNGLSDSDVCALEEITEAVRTYVQEQQTDEDYVQAEKDAYRNIKALIQQENEKFEQDYDDAVSVAEILQSMPDFLPSSDTLKAVSA